MLLIQSILLSLHLLHTSAKSQETESYSITTLKELSPLIQQGGSKPINIVFGLLQGAYSQYIYQEGDCFAGAWEVSQDLVAFSKFSEATFKKPMNWITYGINTGLFGFHFMNSLSMCGYTFSLNSSREVIEDKYRQEIMGNEGKGSSGGAGGRKQKSSGMKRFKKGTQRVATDINAIATPIILVLNALGIYTNLKNEFDYFFGRSISSVILGSLYYFL